MDTNNKYTTTHKVRFLLGEWTQKEFAEYFHLSYRMVTNWDSRCHFPVWLEDIFLLYVLPAVLGMTALDFFKPGPADPDEGDGLVPEDEET